MTTTGNLPSSSRLIYVVGCGRSGTTILGFCLGNAERALDLGEVLYFEKFRGEPNGFEAGTDNYKFWQRVRHRLSQDARWPGFEAFGRLQRRFDAHGSLLPVLLMAPLLRPFGLGRYRAALAAVYASIMLEAGERTCIDSSKYPSRLLHLVAILPPARLAVIHLVRDPEALVRAFSTAKQGPPRSVSLTLAYYFFVNAGAQLLAWLHRGIPSTKLAYEALIADPELALRRVGDDVGLNLSSTIKKVRAGEPLQCGYVFNGNRMRTQPEVVLRRSSNGESARGGWLVRMARGAFMK